MPNLNAFEGFSMLSKVYEIMPALFAKSTYTWISILEHWVFFLGGEETPYEKLKLSFNSPKFRWYPKGLHNIENRSVKLWSDKIKFLIEEELIECGKSVYVDSESEISRYHLHLKKVFPFISMYVGSSAILGEYIGLKFECSNDSKVLKYFKYFFESGIYKYYSTNYIRNKTLSMDKNISKKIKAKLIKTRNWKLGKKLNLLSSIHTLFLILLAMLGFSSCICFFENLKSKERRRVVGRHISLFWIRILHMIKRIKFIFQSLCVDSKVRGYGKKCP